MTDMNFMDTKASTTLEREETKPVEGEKPSEPDVKALEDILENAQNGNKDVVASETATTQSKSGIEEGALTIETEKSAEGPEAPAVSATTQETGATVVPGSTTIEVTSEDVPVVESAPEPKAEAPAPIEPKVEKNETEKVGATIREKIEEKLTILEARKGEIEGQLNAISDETKQKHQEIEAEAATKTKLLEEEVAKKTKSLEEEKEKINNTLEKAYALLNEGDKM